MLVTLQNPLEMCTESEYAAQEKDMVVTPQDMESECIVQEKNMVLTPHGIYTAQEQENNMFVTPQGILHGIWVYGTGK
eukprot:UN03165